MTQKKKRGRAKPKVVKAKPAQIPPPATYDGGVRCGSTKTRKGRPCGQTVLPCRYHDSNHPASVRTSKELPHRQQKLALELAKGTPPQEAGRKVGYKGTSLKSRVYVLSHSPEITALVRRQINAAHSFDTDELTGMLVTDLRSDMHDLLPNNELVKDAHERGVSRQIKEIEQRIRRIPQGTGIEPVIEEITKVKMYSRHEASKQLASILKLESMQSPGAKAQAEFDSTVDQAVERLHNIGVMWTREDVIDKLRSMMVAPNTNSPIIPPTDAEN